MATSSQRKATAKHRARASARGLVRIEVQATRSDASLIRALAQELREQGAKARDLRGSLKKALDIPAETAFDIFGSDLPDAAFDDVLNQPREAAWREIDL